MIDKIIVYRAKKIITMTEAMPEAEAVAVCGHRIVSVGSFDDLKPWLDKHDHEIDDRFADKILMPGLIDPHVHPSLPAVVTQFPFLAPDDWTLPTGKFPGAKTPEGYWDALKSHVAEHDFSDAPFITWGYHQLWHGDVTRGDLDKAFGDKPVMLWHRSFHEIVANTAALEWLNVREDQFPNPDDANWQNGRFRENGMLTLMAISKLTGLIMAPERYQSGIRNFFGMLHQSGVTSCLDMGVGVFNDPEGEAKLIRDTADADQPPARIVLTPICSDFITRGVSPEDALPVVEGWHKTNTDRVMFDHHFKVMMDGAIFSGLSMYGYPGYLDGHDGQWMAPPEVTEAWARTFWEAGYQIHAHTNGDLSADLFIDILRRLQASHPRFDHRMVLEHFAYTTEEQNRQLHALGALVSCNPYYHYILSNTFARDWLGTDRGHQMCRLGQLERMQMPIGLHSDCPMAPLSPLTLAWAAASRETIDGTVNYPSERLSLHAALKAITIDAAWIMRRENDIGSIRAGKLADFAVLDEDPYEVGIDGLRDISIWGVVFEGKPYPVEK